MGREDYELPRLLNKGGNKTPIPWEGKEEMADGLKVLGQGGVFFSWMTISLNERKKWGEVRDPFHLLWPGGEAGREGLRGTRLKRTTLTQLIGSDLP